MASNYEAVSYVETVPMSKTSALRWSRIVPLALLVPIVFAFATPLFGFALLAAVLAAPILVTTVVVMAARQERSA